MENSYQTSGELSKEFYYYLGRLSTKFAEVESNIMSILGKLVIDEVFLINTIIERNPLNQNIQLLKRLNLYREFETAAMQKMIEQVSALRSVRNLFIHSLWGEPYTKNEKVLIFCIEPKIVSEIKRHGRMWASGKEHEFELSYLISKIVELELVIQIQTDILEKLERHRF